MLSEADIRILNTPQELFQAAAAEFIALASAAIRDHGKFTRFDLILLGLGPDGHTASLFPNTAALNETKLLVVANWVEKFKANRITFTYPVLNNAACVIFLVSGADKADMVRTVLEDGRADLPSQRVHPVNGRLLWLLDKGAASKLAKK